ncbi:hypothetical protein EDD53_1002 [Pacificibacter maritimus]|uniref:Glucosyltransferase GtrII-like protein n=1 Tax=Pacificibacter maritimus TaxID=762213 RepID=A0A3N4UWE2_9RHOB|nr:hypothetical protein [Pacificibacter maritimus]RPE71871.1 hypothetical protein EDD53_1002 [Pacificibacter maritimus]
MISQEQRTIGTRRVSASSFSIVAIIAVTAVSIIIFSNGLVLSNYKTLHFILNYDVEFLKRGLVGQIFNLLGFSPWGAAPGVFTLMALLLLSGLYMLATYALLRQRGRSVLALVLVALWASPAALPHLAADFGRFDALLILLLGLWAVCSYALPAKLSLLLLAVVGCVSLLIHEITLVVTMPIGLALWLIRYDKPLISVSTLAFGVAISLVTALVWLFGKGDILTPENLTDLISKNFGVDDYSIKLILLVLFGDMAENITYSIRQAGYYAPVKQHLQFFAIMSGFIFLQGMMVITAVRRLPRHSWFAIMACLTPLALYPLGFDYFRWLSFVLINMTILSVWIMLHNPETTDAIIANCEGWRRCIIALIFLFLVVGPLGVFTSFALKHAPLVTPFLP